MSLRRKKIRWLSQEEGNGCGKKIGQMSGIFKLSEKEMMRRERVGADVNSREAVPAAQTGQVQEGLQESTTWPSHYREAKLQHLGKACASFKPADQKSEWTLTGGLSGRRCTWIPSWPERGKRSPFLCRVCLVSMYFSSCLIFMYFLSLRHLLIIFHAKVLDKIPQVSVESEY